ncbi:hypothetical protein [Rhizobium ruizarguesonis]|uniref:hypothetical protein n=1 Tax=Rhizobium ruizarguesonis TaxID=2081791 RepID=UPI001FEE4588|nr:hypothetical protein [Rhizobium ruizarguesonis]
MSSSGKSVYQVTQILTHGVAIISEVREGETAGGRIRETKDAKVVLRGVGSFWLLTGDKDDTKLVIEKPEDPRQPGWPMVSLLTSPIRGNSTFKLPPSVEAFDQPGRYDVRSFATATKLSVGYSPRDIGYADVVARLRDGSLSIPSNDVSAIEVKAGVWLTTQFVRNSSGRYGLAPGATARSLFVTAMESRPDMIRLPSGLIVFLSQPRWTFAEEADLRPENEVIASAEKWLARAKSASEAMGEKAGEFVEVLRHLVASTVNPEEKADLTAAARLLAGRQSLLDVMPQMLARDPAFQERISEYEAAERERLKTELHAQLEAEVQSETSRLQEIRVEIIDAETRLAIADRREVLLRHEAEKHDEAIRVKIAEAAKHVQDEARARTDGMRKEMDMLWETVSELAIPAAATIEAPRLPEPEPAPPMQVEQPPEVAISIARADENARKSIMAGLSSATGISSADLVSIMLRSTEDIPVLIGEHAVATAADIVAAIGGEDSAVAFCDPSRISWQDLMRDETSDLAAAVARAKANPDVLVPIAMCGITNGPCEYWVPQFIESRRIGRLPRNLAIIASVGVDGMRVSVPDSILRFLVPFVVPDTAKPVRKLFAGAWTADLEFNRGRLVEAREVFSDMEGLDGAALQKMAKTLSRTPADISIADVGKSFVRHAQWLATISADGQYDFKNNFKNIEG